MLTLAHCDDVRSPDVCHGALRTDKSPSPTGLTGERPGPAQDAGGDSMSRLADPAAEGPPVPPPRKHSVRSRADGLRDALPDLSPVKGQWTALGGEGPLWR